VHNCAWEKTEIKIARDKKYIRFDKRRPAFALTIQVILIQLN
jgi:hypothetical protein